MVVDESSGLRDPEDLVRGYAFRGLLESSLVNEWRTGAGGGAGVVLKMVMSNLSYVILHGPPLSR